MFRSFDVYDNLEMPIPILCNPNGKELYVISSAINMKAKLRICAYSEFSFDIGKTNSGTDVMYYDLIQKLRIVKVDGYGVFFIDSISEHRDGLKTTKSVSCKSLDALFATKSFVGFEGTYKLYDIMGGDSILKRIIEKFPDWSVGNVDGDLLSLYRTYNISEQNCYDFMMNDLSEDFQCVFEFDTFEKKIYVKTVRNAVKNTDIFVSFDNLMKDLKIDTSTDGLKTSLEVYGADGLDIYDVNPLGSKIYNFSYFKTLEWMSQDTIDALTLWEEKVKSWQPSFAYNASTIKDQRYSLITYNSELIDLQGELKALEGVLSAQVTQGISGEDTNYRIRVKEDEIYRKKQEIADEQYMLDMFMSSQDGIRNEVKLENNLTHDQLMEVYAIENITGGTYTNDAFVKTSSMSSVDIQDESQRLYDLAITVLDKVSQPIYTFTANIVNFVALQWADVYASQLELGCQFTVGIDDDTLFYPILLEYEIDFSDVSKCTMTFCNSMRFSNNEFDFASLFDGVKSAVSSINTSKGLWEDYIKSGDKDSLFSLKNDALDLANKDIVSTSGQDFKIDQTGIRGKKLMPDGSVSPNQIWISNNSICMTTDNWNHSALALGEITFNGIKKYGLCTDILVGNLVAGENLVIKNQNNTFTVDAQGLTATNASFTFNKSDGGAQIVISPDTGIKITSRVRGVYQDTFYVDTEGNLVFRGDLTGATGTFSGDIYGAGFYGGSININNNFVVDEGGNCSANSINITGGSFETGVIDGSYIYGGDIQGTNIYGTNISGTSIEGSYIEGTQITGGSIYGTDISGSFIHGCSFEVEEDIYVGSHVILRPARFAETGIEFGYGSISCNDSVMSISTPGNGLYVDGEELMSRYQVEDIVVDYLNSRALVENVVFNDESRLLKIYYTDYSYDSYYIP